MVRSLKDTADKFAYQGFDPLKIANSVSALAEEGKRDLEEDLFQLIILFYCRGANAQRLRDPALSRISDEDTQRTVTTLLTTYNVQSKPGRSSTVITLPRISLAFPAQTLKVLAGLIIVSGQKKGEAWLLEPNVLPTIISENHQWWPAYIAAQKHMSKKLSGNCPPPDADERVEAFAQITRGNSPFSAEDQGKLFFFQV